ncbi:MAG TPA: DUF3189 family protein [Symbiobacteriaceae bacterium]|nr:DUF3189 family protein [Symbiobacteriaceae bacterium]
MSRAGLIVIYHSRGAFPARLAAAIHAGRLPPRPPQRAAELHAALEALGGAGAMSAEGLWAAGTDAAGHRIFALGRSSRPDVAHRAFHSIARLAGIESAAFRLHNVGPAIAWRDLRVKVLKAVGLTGLARRALVDGLRRAWGAAAGAAAEAAGDSDAQGPAASELSGGPKIIYYCYGAAHSSITAANLHLGHLPLDRRPGPWLNSWPPAASP